MIEKASAKNQAPLPREADSAASGVPVMSPWGPVEGASTGPGTVNDPGGNDNKPPGIAELELLA